MPFLSRRHRAIATLWLLSGFLLCQQALSAENQLWQKQSIYQIITDRFFDADTSNDNAEGNYDPAGHSGTSVHGGDFKGIEQKLDYIKALGVTAIWISPIVLNVRGEFHGYAAYDFTKVAPHWGSLADLQHLVQAAHARGLLVIDDIVVNHAGRLIDSGDAGFPHFKRPPDGYHLRWRQPGREYPPPFNLSADHPALTNLFHNQGDVENYADSIEVQLGELHGLNDFRTESPYVRSQMQKIYEDWIGQAGFDGFRIDTVKHVEMGFWQDWCPAIHAFAAAHGKPDFFMFGEVLNHSDSQCASYVCTNGGGPFKLDSVLDYPLYFKIKNVFAKANAKTSDLSDRYASLASNYDTASQKQLVTFLDNHDQPRFLSPGQADNNLERLKTALVFLHTAPGIPCLYYGTEQAFNGSNDPYDREDMFAGEFKDGPPGVDSFNMTHPLFLWVAELNNFRRLYSALQTGSFTILWSDKKGPGLFAFARRLDTQEAFIVFNTSKTNQTLPSCQTIYSPQTKLVNLLDPRETAIVLAGSRIPAINVPGESAKIFIAQSQVSPLEPMVTSILPMHDARDVKPNSRIVFHFNRPMDTLSVETAFSAIPSIQGTFSWSKAHDTMTFMPQREGFPARTTVQLHIDGSARDASGLKFYSPFASEFKTSEVADQPK